MFEISLLIRFFVKETAAAKAQEQGSRGLRCFHRSLSHDFTSMLISFNRDKYAFFCWLC